jgi:hypothetical protein
VKRSTKYYIAQTPIGQMLAELQQEIVTPPLFDTSRLKQTFLFMGVDTHARYIQGMHCSLDARVAR